MWRHPKYYHALAKIRKEFEREQAGQRANEQANKRASKQAIKRPMRTRASSVECDPNH